MRRRVTRDQGEKGKWRAEIKRAGLVCLDGDCRVCPRHLSTHPSSRLSWSSNDRTIPLPAPMSTQSKVPDVYVPIHPSFHASLV